MTTPLDELEAAIIERIAHRRAVEAALRALVQEVQEIGRQQGIMAEQLAALVDRFAPPRTPVARFGPRDPPAADGAPWQWEKAA